MLDLSLDIFTPAHRNDYLLDAYNSIKNQSYDHWLLYPNNGLTIDDIPKIILEDPRTVIVTSEDSPTTNIGALKRICCSASDADILAELDFDDTLCPGIIDKIKEAFQDSEVVFVYSDSVQYNNEDKSSRFYGAANAENNYDAVYGWQYYDYWQDGVLYKAAITPDPIPAHVSIIHNAPDHVRSFRRSAYEEVGGYDAGLSICDDQDLMCRLFQKGKFKHLKECGYLYRVYGSNSWLQRNEDIQTTTVEMQKKYLHPMVEGWAKQNNYKMIDICGRFNKPEGYLSVDLKDADINADLNERWPFEDSSIGVVRAFDALEHLDNIVFTMSEIHRVLMPGGYLLSQTPSTSGFGAFQDPTHKSFLNRNSFYYYTRAEQAQYIDNTSIRFKSIILEEFFPNDWALNNNISYIRADLICLKDSFRPHGLIEI